MYKKISSQAKSDLNRVLSAAVVSRSFRNALLNDPAKAIAGGYLGEQFHLSSKTRQRISSMRAVSLTDFAAQLTQSS